jgi:hypothetical protein
MNQESKKILSVTVSSGRPGPGDAPKKPRRKKRAPKKSEVSDPEFGTVSSAEPSHDENRPQQRITNRKRRGGLTTPDSDTIEDVMWATSGSKRTEPQNVKSNWISPNEYGAKKRIDNIDSDYSDIVKKHRYKHAKRSAYANAKQRNANAYRAGFVLGMTLGLVIGLGGLWLYMLCA